MIERYTICKEYANWDKNYVERFVSGIIHKGTVHGDDAIPNLGEILNPDLQRIVSVIVETPDS